MPTTKLTPAMEVALDALAKPERADGWVNEFNIPGRTATFKALINRKLVERRLSGITSFYRLTVAEAV